MKASALMLYSTSSPELWKAYRTAPYCSKHVTAFLFADDMFGLSEEGRYTNSTEALTPLAVYRFPVSVLRSRLAKDADLEFHLICKLIHELRETQRHAFLLARRRALSRVAMFLQLLENLQVARGERTAEIYLPMNRSDIGEYLGMSLEAVSRAFRGFDRARYHQEPGPTASKNRRPEHVRQDCR